MHELYHRTILLDIFICRGNNNYNTGICSELIKLLITKGADINATNNYHQTAFSIAIQEIMLKRSIDLDINLFKNPNKTSLNTALLVAAPLLAFAKSSDYEYRKNIFAWLLSKGADINAVSYNGISVLMTTAYEVTSENYKVIDYLIKEGVSINAIDSKGRNILHFMLQSTLGEAKVTDLVLKFINAGVNVNVYDSQGNTPLNLSLTNKPLKEVTIALLKKGASINTKDNQGETALIKVARKGDYDLVKLLIHYIADLNIRNNLGVSAVMCASDYGHYDIVKLLLDNGATYNNDDYIHKDTSSIIEPKAGQIVSVGSKLLVKLQPQKNEEWFCVIYDSDLTGRKLMEYDHTSGVFTGEIMIPKDLKESTYVLLLLAVVATKDKKISNELNEIILQPYFLPNDARYISFKRNIAIK